MVTAAVVWLEARHPSRLYAQIVMNYGNKVYTSMKNRHHERVAAGAKSIFFSCGGGIKVKFNSDKR